MLTTKRLSNNTEFAYRISDLHSGSLAKANIIVPFEEEKETNVTKQKVLEPSWTIT